MEEYIPIVFQCFLAIVAIVGIIIAFFKGRKNKKLYQSLSEKEQRDILYNYMVDEAKKVQKKSKFFQPTMSKQQVAEEKRDTVLEKLTMYAKGAGFSWYSETEWSDKLTTLLSDAKELQK